MNELLVTNQVSTIDSREVAEMVGKEHKNLLRDIQSYIGYLTSSDLSPLDFFMENQYLDGKGERRPCFKVTRKGCELIANKMTGKKGILFTAAYVDRFHKMESYISENDLSPELKAIFFHDKKIKAVENEVSGLKSSVVYLQNNMTIDYGQQHELNQYAKSVVVDVLGGMKSGAYKTMNRKAFQAIWRDYKDHFKVNSYKNTPAARYDEAMGYISNWRPDYNLRLEIQEANIVRELINA